MFAESPRRLTSGPAALRITWSRDDDPGPVTERSPALRARLRPAPLLVLLALLAALAWAGAAAAVAPSGDVFNGITDPEGDVPTEPMSTTYQAPDVLSVTAAYLDNGDAGPADDTVQSAAVVDAGASPGVTPRIYAQRVVAWWIDADGSSATGYAAGDFGRGADLVIIAFGTGDGVPTSAQVKRWSDGGFANTGTVPLVATGTSFAWSLRSADIGAGRGRNVRIWVESAKIDPETGAVLRSDRAPDATGDPLTLAVPPPPPAARTGDVAQIGATSVQIGGVVDAGGSPTQWFIRFGVGSVNDGSSVPQAVDGSGAVAVSTELSGLAPATEYQYQIVARSAWGESQGEVRTFTTSPRIIAAAAPAATGAPRRLSTTSAVLVGAVGVPDAPVEWWFEWGRTALYGKRTPVRRMGPGVGARVVTAAIRRLDPDTRYHYRLVVRAGGRRYDGDPEVLRTAAAGRLTITGDTAGSCRAGVCTVRRLHVRVRGRDARGRPLAGRTLRAGLTVRARCVTRCRMSRSVALTGRGTTLSGDLGRILRRAPLRVGATLEVRVQRPGFTGAVYRVTAGRNGVRARGCLLSMAGAVRCGRG